MTPTQSLIQQKFSHLQPQYDFVLAPLTYMKVGGPAEVLLDLQTTQDIIDVVTFCNDQHIPVTVFGGASNVIIDDEGLQGVVLTLSNEEYHNTTEETGEIALVRAGAGFKTALFVRRTVDDGFTGLEYFLGVPGKLGGAIYNNAHYLSDLIGEHVHRVQVITPQNEVKWFTKAECDFAYDYSVFHKTADIILTIEFALKKGDLATSKEMIKEATLYRAQTQPLGEPSSGCYFRNTPNTPELQKQFPQFAERREVPSAFLIDQAGLKGEKIGDVEVSQKHAAFFINKGKGTSKDLKQLAEIVKQRIHDKFHVELREEVFFLENKS
jgi:UDP-N-acetylmuramate dehydrogenase